jgi:hypothetical protein
MLLEGVWYGDQAVEIRWRVNQLILPIPPKQNPGIAGVCLWEWARRAILWYKLVKIRGCHRIEAKDGTKGKYKTFYVKKVARCTSFLRQD